MKDKDYPDYIDEISKIYENLWINILDGSKNSLSDYHTFSLATCSQNQVSNRTVVLRDCNKKDRTMSFHTNNLSKKIDDINLNPIVECIFYSKINKTQIRISGIAEIFTMNNICEKKWVEMSSQSKQCYFQNIAPGEIIDNPNQVQMENPDDLNIISKNFAIIKINISMIDWLYLSSKGHRRVKFDKNRDFEGSWASP
ncbi:MAG: pyridoxamine 5'-phosphate oxidase family protein [Pelagibacterales bacterium]|nr:pyridoxamine 5'-phosphate oxidase family protein [Pelagibacterales bacterium]